MKFKKYTPSELLQSKPTVKKIRLRKRTPLYAIFDNIRSLYNVGAMFRTSDAALVSKVFLTGIIGKPPRYEIDKSALGACEIVPWEYCPDSLSMVKKLKSSGISIIALELTRKSVPYFKKKYIYPVCLIVGNEVDGIGQEVLDLCDDVVQIPMLGRANSLNVSTAYGIAIYEMLKQYKYDKN